MANLTEMSKPGAETEYFENGVLVRRKFTTRERTANAKILKSFCKLGFDQEKLDSEVEDEAEQEVALNDFVTPYMETAGQRMTAEAKSQGLKTGSELPTERKQEIFEETKREISTAHPQASVPVASSSVMVIPPEERNDFALTAEQQRELMRGLADMALPGGKEYRLLKPRERQSAYYVMVMFCRLRSQQHNFDRKRRQRRGRRFDWGEAQADFQAAVPVVLADREGVDGGFYQRKEERLRIKT